MTAAPSKIDLAPGAYTVPGSPYQLVISGPGTSLVRPAAQPSLIDLVTPATSGATAKPGGLSTAPTWLVVVIGLVMGIMGIHLWNGHTVPEPIPAPGPVDPTPTPQPDPKPRPDWIPPKQEEPPATKPVFLEWRPLSWAPGWEGLGRDIDGQFMIMSWRRSAEAVPLAAQPAPIVAQPRQVLRLPYCTTGTCP